MRDRGGRGWVLAAASLAASGCAGPVYLHSPSLQQATAAAAAALPPAAAALKPFDDQLAMLQAFAADEDRAVARYWVGVRDAHFARLVGRERLDGRTRRIAAQIDARLIELTGSATAAAPPDPAPLLAARTALDALAAAGRRAYLATPGADAGRDLDCAAVLAGTPAAEADRLAASANALENRFGQLARLCAAVAAKDAEIARGAATGGEIGAARRDATGQSGALDPRLGDRAAALEAQVKAADGFARTGAAAGLEAWLAGIHDALDGAAAAARLAGWQAAADGLDAALKARACAAAAVPAADKAEAGCDSLPPTGTAGRIRATWGLAKALAQVADVDAPARRPVQWLLAARAIVAAERADAALALDEARALAAAAGRRADALGREAAFLQQAKGAEAGAPGDCSAGPAGGAGGHCQFAAYVDAWNEGRIPAQVLAYRPVQIGRAFAVRRSRAVAQKQHALATAGTATLRDHGAGGVTEAMIAQLLLDAAFVGVGAGGL